MLVLDDPADYLCLDHDIPIKSAKLIAFPDPGVLGAGDREQAVGATRRFGDATLARGW